MNDENNVKRVIPMIMLVFISSATMISCHQHYFPAAMQWILEQPYHGKSS